jgi:hypothetical protein
MEALERTGRLDDWQANKIWSVLVVGSVAMTFVIIEPAMVGWLK